MYDITNLKYGKNVHTVEVEGIYKGIANMMNEGRIIETANVEVSL